MNNTTATRCTTRVAVAALVRDADHGNIQLFA